MTYQNNRIIDRLNGIQTDQIPVWLMRQAGRHLPGYRKLRQSEPNFLKFIENETLTTAAALEPIERYDLDASIIFSDILTIPYWMGWPVVFKSGYGIEIPRLAPNQLDQLSLQRLSDNLYFLDKGMRSLKNTITDRPIIGFAGAPWTLSCYLLDNSKNNFMHARQSIYSNAHFLQEMMHLLTRGILMSIDTQINAGADIIMLFDSWAGLLPRTIYIEQCMPHILKIQKHVAAKNKHFILFSKGQSYNTQSICSPDCITLDWQQQWPEQPKHIIQGGFDPAILLSSPETIKRFVSHSLLTLPTDHYIANLGHGIPPESSPENVIAFIEAIRSFDCIKNRVNN